MPRFDPFLLFQVLRHCAWIRSFFISGSPALCPDFIIFSSIVSEFSSSTSASCPSIAYLFRHRVRLSLSFLASHPDFIIFFGIVSGFSLSSSASCPSIAYLFRHRALLSLSFLASCPYFPHLPRHHVQASLIFFGIEPGFHYLFRHRVRIFLIFLGIVSEHRLSFSASHPTFSYLHWHCVWITHLPRHCAWVSLSPLVVETQFR